MTNPISTDRIAKQFCDTAGEIITGDRAKSHGDAGDNFQNIADLWSAYLGISISASQVSLMMVMLKIARAKMGAFNNDDYVDMCGYAALAGEIAALKEGTPDE